MPADSRSQQIAEIVRDEILSGQYRVGERLPSERDLARRFEANRGAVREALKKLEQLGIADIQPGGARVLPVEEATVEAVGHLLDLGSHPDPDLVSQVFEAFRVVVSASVRLSVQRASDLELEAVAERIDALTRGRPSREEQMRREIELSNWFVDQTGNLVLKLMRRAVANRLARAVEAPRLASRLPRSVLAVHAGELADAVRKRDDQRAADLMFDGMAAVHDEIVDALRTRAKAGGEARASNRASDPKPEGDR